MLFSSKFVENTCNPLFVCGTTTIGVSNQRIVVLAGADEEQPVAETAAVMTLSENTPAFTVDGLEYYCYWCSTTPGCGSTTGCGGNTATSVWFSADKDTMVVGTSMYLRATVCPPSAANQCLVWFTSDSSIISVDNSGRVRANAPGQATISAMTADGRVFGSIELSVVVDIVTIYLCMTSSLVAETIKHYTPGIILIPGVYLITIFLWNSRSIQER